MQIKKYQVLLLSWTILGVGLIISILVTGPDLVLKLYLSKLAVFYIETSFVMIGIVHFLKKIEECKPK